jgi:disulfide bond formation protein DsbB
MSLETINYGLALGTLAMQISGAGFLALYFLQKKFPDLGDIADFLSRRGILIAFLVAFVGSCVTVIHSGIFGLPPCPLCWWQRAFLYPQVALFAVALLWKRDRAIADYSIALSLVGLGIAIYHHVLQMYPMGSLPCPAEGGVSCGQILFLEFGYITYPMMAISAFAFLIILMLFVRQRGLE